MSIKLRRLLGLSVIPMLDLLWRISEPPLFSYVCLVADNRWRGLGKLPM